MSFDDNRFFNELPAFLLGAAKTGIDEWLDTCQEEAKAKSGIGAIDESDLFVATGIKRILTDGERLVIEDVSDGLHLFRIKFERL